VVEYGGLLVLVAAIIGALSSFGSSGVAGYISSGVQHVLCEINLGSVSGSCPNTASPGATSGSQSASLASEDRTTFLKPLTEDVTGRVSYFIQRLETLDAELEKAAGRHDASAEDLRQFAERFRGVAGVA
jgi:hypothetical protein